MPSATITISGNVTGQPRGATTIGPITVSSVVAVGQVTTISLASGANVITGPANSTGCLINLPPTNTVVTTLKGVTGDTGIAIGKIGTTFLSWDPTAVPAIVLTSASAQTGLFTEISFF